MPQEPDQSNTPKQAPPAVMEAAERMAHDAAPSASPAFACDPWATVRRRDVETVVQFICGAKR